MTNHAPRIIRIAAALIDNDQGELLLVRKSGTAWFMQAGGKIEAGETAISALRRELLEEIGIVLDENDATYLGCFRAPAANESDAVVEAELFHARVRQNALVSAEIEEAVWVSGETAARMNLAPLTRDHVLPLARAV